MQNYCRHVSANGLGLFTDKSIDSVTHAHATLSMPQSFNNDPFYRMWIRSWNQ